MRTLLVPAAAVVAGLVIIGVALAGQETVPQAPQSARGTLHPTPAASPHPQPHPNNAPAHGPGRPSDQQSSWSPPLPPSPPVSLSIPAINVHTAVFAIGKTHGGRLAVPQPGPNLNKAAWYQNSPTPGQTGPSVIEGHVDSEQGPSVFFDLANIRPGDQVHVTRRDRSSVTYTVNAVRDFAKKHFPTQLVYGGSQHTPTLRLITCSDFNERINHHTGNLIVFAHLTSTQHPTQHPTQHSAHHHATAPLS